jgi:hypothetical protein
MPGLLQDALRKKQCLSIGIGKMKQCKPDVIATKLKG